jgi:hypothetical protein
MFAMRSVVGFSGTLIAVASVLLAAAIRIISDCANLESDLQLLGLALVFATGGALSLAVAVPLDRVLGGAVAGCAGVLGAFVFGLSFVLYAEATDLGFCPS